MAIYIYNHTCVYIIAPVASYTLLYDICECSFLLKDINLKGKLRQMQLGVVSVLVKIKNNWCTCVKIKNSFCTGL